MRARSQGKLSGLIAPAWDVAAAIFVINRPFAPNVSVRENMLLYNGMFYGVFELLADSRGQVGTVNRICRLRVIFLGAQSELGPGPFWAS